MGFLRAGQMSRPHNVASKGRLTDCFNNLEETRLQQQLDLALDSTAWTWGRARSIPWQKGETRDSSLGIYIERGRMLVPVNPRFECWPLVYRGFHSSRTHVIWLVGSALWNFETEKFLCKKVSRPLRILPNSWVSLQHHHDHYYCVLHVFYQCLKGLITQ